jgi:hypothetical protein
MKIPEEIFCRLKFKRSPHERPDAPGIESIAPVVQPCDDCDRTVAGRRVESTLCQSPFVFWRTQCITCRRYRNPKTGEFERLTPGEIITISRKVYLRCDK